jgi:Holliday junction resolvasome RuvABC endonuclease subunit
VPKALNIIAFDLGRNFAWASNWRGRCNTHSLVLEGERAHRQSQLLTYLLSNHAGLGDLDVAVYETPFARGRDATRSLWGIAGIIEACATHAGLPVVDVAVPTIKKFATGHGKASKMDMIAAAQRMGYKGNNEHEADAVCLLRYAEANLERLVET